MKNSLVKLKHRLCFKKKKTETSPEENGLVQLAFKFASQNLDDTLELFLQDQPVEVVSFLCLSECTVTGAATYIWLCLDP